MTIKVISFDLDDTLWPIMPTILNAEKVTNAWIKKNYPGVGSLLGSKETTQIRDRLLKKNPDLKYQLSTLRELYFIELGLLAGYSESEAKQMASSSFEIFFNERNNVVLFEGVEDCLNDLKEQYSLGVITNGNADLKKIGIDHYFDFSFSASDLNASKPDPIMFEAVKEFTGCTGQQICHVGDHPLLDVKASHDCEMNPIWFNKEGLDWPVAEIEPLEVNDWKEMEEAIKTF
jgi:HAD superfamily hydrolase (TIGR01549 family)